MLELSEAALDVVGMNDDVKEGICDAEVSETRVESLLDIAECTIELCIFGT